MDMFATHQEQDGYGLSSDLWKNFPTWQILGLNNRNVGIGFFEDFRGIGNTSLYDGWIRLATDAGLVAQIASEANAFGLMRLKVVGDTAEDEAVIAYGNGLSADFKLANHDLCFETRLRVSSVTAAKHNFFAGLSEKGAAVTDKLFTDSDVFATDYDHIGFLHLAGAAADLDGAYAVDGVTVDGSGNTDLDTLQTLVASTFYKLGMRYRADTNSLHWFVNGVEKAHVNVANLTASTFPNGNFMTPTIGLKDKAGDTAMNLDVDWVACAQCC